MCLGLGDLGPPPNPMCAEPGSLVHGARSLRLASAQPGTGVEDFTDW
jgi:hypothetical protein